MNWRWLLFLVLLSGLASAQVQPGKAKRVTSGTAAPPAACVIGDVYVRSGATLPGFYFCSAANTWKGPLFSGTDLATATAAGAVLPRDNNVIDTSGNVDWNPHDSTVAFFKDDFTVKSITTETIGELGWRYTATTSCTPLGIVSALPNVGIFQMTTGAGAGNGCALDLSGLGPYGLLGAIGGVAGAEQHFIFKLPQTTNSSFRVGYVIGTAAGVVEPTAGAWLRYEKNPSSGGTTQATVTAVEDHARTTATYTTPTAHGYHVGDSMTSTGCGTATFSLTGNIASVPSATTFTITTAVPAADATSNTCTTKVADTTFKFETRKASASDSYDTGQAPNTSNFYHLKIRNIASGKVGLTLYDSAGAVLVTEKTLCPANCDVTSSNVDTASAMSPALILFSATGGGGTAVAAQMDFYSFKVRGLTR